MAMTSTLPSLLSQPVSYPAATSPLQTLRPFAPSSSPYGQATQLKPVDYALFESPSGGANPNHWARQDFLTADQCIPVLWGRDPDAFNYELAFRLRHQCARAARFCEDLSTLNRSIVAGSLGQRIAPHQLLVWARQKGMTVNSRFATAVSRFWPNETVDWRAVAHQHQIENFRLNERIAERDCLVDLLKAELQAERSEHQTIQAALEARAVALSRHITGLQSSADEHRAERSRLQDELDAARVKHSEEQELTSEAIDRARVAEQQSKEVIDALSEVIGCVEAETVQYEGRLRVIEAERDEARANAAELTDQLNALSKRPRSPSATTRELRTAQRLIFGFVTAKYQSGSNPKSGPNIQRVVDDLARVGVTADDETIKKHYLAGSEENSR